MNKFFFNKYKIKKLVSILILFTLFFSFKTNVNAEITTIGDTENFNYTGDVKKSTRYSFSFGYANTGYPEPHI